MKISTRNVVVVGNRTAARSQLRLALNLAGYGVYQAASAREARKLIDKHLPMAAIIEVTPESDEAFRLARDIRTNRNHRHMVILASSSLDVSQVDGEELALASGCDAFLADAAVGGLADMLDAYLPVEAPIALLGGEVVDSTRN